MSNDFELDIIRGQVSALIDQGRANGLSEQEQAAITAEVNRLWVRLSRARPRHRRGAFSTAATGSTGSTGSTACPAGSRRRPRPPLQSL